MTRTLLAIIAILFTLAALSATAGAQPGMTAPIELGPAPAPLPADAKDPNTATLLAIGGTVVPWALVIASAQGNSSGLLGAALVGTVLAPSAGHWYAGQALTPGLGMRIGGSALAVYGLAQLFQCIDGCASGTQEGGAAPFLLGGALFVGGTIYDIATAHRAANEWNRSHLRVAPTMLQSDGRSVVGLGLGGAF